METIEREFSRRFRDYALPKDKVERREGGVLRDRSDCIYYSFGKNEKGEHLNVYTMYKFAWGHIHLRIYESGKVENLPEEWDILFSSRYETDEEKSRKRAEMEEHNKMVRRMLEEEGIQAVMDGELTRILQK